MQVANDFHEALLAVPLANMEKEVDVDTVVMNENGEGLEYGSPNQCHTNQEIMFLNGVKARDEELCFEWVILKMEEFGSFLGLSYEGFESNIKTLFKAIEH